MSLALWPKWIRQSVALEFDANKGHLYLQLDGFWRPPTEEIERVELRMDIDLCEETQDEWHATVYINALITTIKTPSDEYRMDRNIGIVSNILGRSIEVRKHGDGDAYIGCLQRTSGPTITNFGAIEKSQDILQSTVEAEYQLFARDDS